MSFFLGGSFKAKPQFTGLATQTSTSSQAITIAWGQNRLAPNIIWQGDFKATKVKQKSGKGGPKINSYKYSGSYQLALCWGEIEDVTRVWKDQSTETDYAKLGFSLFKGPTPQSPWGYLTTAHPDQALGYSGIAHLDVGNYDLGNSNNLPQHSFEVEALRWDSGLGGGADALDADPALIVQDFLADESFGVGFDLSVLSNVFSTVDATTTGDSAFQTYCRAIGFAMSPFLTSQQAAGETLQKWANLCNTAIAWTGYSLKFHPWGPDEIDGNGVKYLPDFPIRYYLTDKDFIYTGQDPVRFDRVDPADAANSFSIIISNRENEYNDLPVPWRDQGLIDQYGMRREDTLEAKEICDPAMAAVMVTLMGQKKAYNRNTFNFTLPSSYCRLEPMDILDCTTPQLGNFRCVIETISETEDDEFEIAATEYHASVSTKPANGSQQISNTPVNTLADPGPVNDPIILEPPASLSGSHQLWIGISGGDGTVANLNWGGANVWVSTDDITYNQVGSVDTASRMGVLTANLATYGGVNPDTIHTLRVNLAMSEGELSDAASPTDAAAGVTVSYVGGEYLSYETVNLTGDFAYDLDDLWRGQYDIPAAAHTTGAPFVRLDDNVFKYDVPIDYIGTTIYLKFQSFNIFGDATQDLADVDSWEYDVTGAGWGTGDDGKPAVPDVPTPSGTTGIITLTWDPNSPNDNITGYEYYRAEGHGADFADAELIATVPAAATSYTDSSAISEHEYTVFLVALNPVGSSDPTAGADVTTAEVNPPSQYGFAFTWPDPVEDKPIAYFDSPIEWKIAIGLPNSQGTIGDSVVSDATPPSGNTDFDIQSPPGSSIGTMRFATASLTATFIMGSNHTIPLGQPVAIIAPSNLNGLAGTIYGSILGKR